MKKTIEQAAKEYADGLRIVDKKNTYDNIEVYSSRMVAFKRGAEWQAIIAQKEHLIELIESLPDSDKHIYTDKDGVTVTSEWLVGNFLGVGFVANTKEEAIEKLINYLDRHITHDSMVGDIVRKSGYPDLNRVKEYCLMYVFDGIIEPNKDVSKCLRDMSKVCNQFHECDVDILNPIY